MNKLWLRLALAFLLISALSVGAVAFFANRQVEAQFQRYVVMSRVTEQGLDASLAAYYAQAGTWDGVEGVLNEARPGRGFGGMGGMMGRAEILVADAQGRIVAPASQAGTTLTAAERDIAVPVRVEGQIAGYVLMQTPANMQFTAAAQAFLAQINQSLLLAALIAAIAGALLGVVIARGVSKPLSALAAAARRVEQGKLNERVPVTGSEEVANLATAFNEMTGALQHNEQLRRNMAADIAHELRTPLTVMQGNLRAILDDVYPLSKHEVALIYDETITLSRLVSDLRDVSLAEAGQLSLKLVSQPIAPQIERAVQHWRELYESKGVALEVTLADALPAVQIDQDRLAQVLNNLLANALRHTPAHGRVAIVATHEGAVVRVTLRDSGAGISPDDAPHVFDRFWRTDESRSRESGGSGLGLAIARQVVEAMHGQIGVKRENGAGACFWFTLPVTDGTTMERPQTGE
jgi:two-component system OmpR family sensor kinase/two-component system sensor histidine kinase BaeS